MIGRLKIEERENKGNNYGHAARRCRLYAGETYQEAEQETPAGLAAYIDHCLIEKCVLHRVVGVGNPDHDL